MTKSFVVVIALLGLITSCCGGGTCSSKQATLADTLPVAKDQIVEVYSGVIPAASAEGMMMTLSLRGDGTFAEVLLAQQAGAAEELTEGRFELRGDTLVLIPSGEAAVVRGLLSSDAVRLLDADGNLPELPYELKLQK